MGYIKIDKKLLKLLLNFKMIAKTVSGPARQTIKGKENAKDGKSACCTSFCGSLCYLSYGTPKCDKNEKAQRDAADRMRANALCCARKIPKESQAPTSTPRLRRYKITAQ